jgi:transcriptional regulator with XRE-family HTH domain
MMTEVYPTRGSNSNLNCVTDAVIFGGMKAPEIRGPDRRDTEQPHLAFGRVLEAARENYRLNRNELATVADVAYSMLFNVERGRRRASDAFIEKVASQLGLRADRMIKVRNALEVDRKFPLGRRSEVQRFMAGAEGGVASSVAALEHRLDSLVEDRLTDLYSDSVPTVQAEYALLGIGSVDDDPELVHLVREISQLTQLELARVRGYVHRIMEERTPENPKPRSSGPST